MTSGCGGRTDFPVVTKPSFFKILKARVDKTERESQASAPTTSSTEVESDTQDRTVEAHSDSVTQSVTESATNTATTSSHYVYLAWSASAGSIAGYNVYRGATSLGPFQKINSVLEPATNYTDHAVTAGQTYHYVVTAVSGTLESKFSAQVIATVPTP